MTMWHPEIYGGSGPTYKAIVKALAEDISRGTLAPGTRLPTHRALARKLGVSIGTVSRAYAEAERRELVRGEVGRGTFVSSEPAAEETPGLSFAGGMALTSLDLSVNLPPGLEGSKAKPALKQAFDKIISVKNLGRLLTYQEAAGMPHHREAGARWLRRSGFRANHDNILVCAGAHHALTVTLMALTKPGDVVATEQFTYPAIKTLAGLLQLDLRGLPMDQEGLLPDALEALCRNNSVRMLYCVPTIQNPTTRTMSEDRRRELASIARKFDVAILEDDCHGLLATDAPGPLSRLAPERSYYIASTSKTIAPGLRVAFLLAPNSEVPRLAASLWSTTWMAAPIMAEILAIWIGSGQAERLLQIRRREAVARQKLARQLLGTFDLETHPASYHLWLRLPEPWRADEFAAEAKRRGAAVTPPTAFVVGRQPVPHSVRVCLGALPERAKVRRGLSILRELLEHPPKLSLLVT